MVTARGVLMLLVASSGLYCLLTMFSISNATAYPVPLGLAAAATALFLFLGLFVRRDFRLIEPFTLVVLAVVVGVVLKPAYLFLGPAEQVRFLLVDEPDTAFLLGGAVLATVLVATLSTGYVLYEPQRAPRAGAWFGATSWHPNVVRAAVVLFLSIAVVSMVLYTRKMGLVSIWADISSKRFYKVEGADYESSALGYYRWGASLVGHAFLIALAHTLWLHDRLSRRGMAGLIVLGLLSVAFPFFNSSRTGIAMVLIKAVVLWVCMKGRVPTWLTFGGVATLLALLLAVTALRPKSANLDALSNIPGADVLTEITVGSRHFLDLTKTAHIVEAVPSTVPFQYGRTFFTWAVMPVPRTVWPGKPTLGSGPLLGPAVFGTGGAGVPPGIVAEWYLNFGVLGVIVGGLIIGLLLRAVYERFRPWLHTPNAALLYASLVVPMSWGVMTGDFSRMVVTSMTSVLPLVAFLYLARPAAHAREARSRWTGSR